MGNVVYSTDPVNQREYLTAVGSSYQVASSGGPGYGQKFTAERFNLSDGSIDTSGWGPSLNGHTQTGFAFGPDGVAYAATLDHANTNTIVAVGTGSSNFVATRFNTDGTLDSSFGVNGVVGNTDFGNADGTTNTIDFARSVFIRPDGVIIVGGYNYTTGTDGQIALAALLDMNKVSVL